MRIPALMAVSLLLAGCASQELRRLETEQAQLQAEYDVLEENVVALRTALVEAGLMTAQQAEARTAIPAAKKGSKAKKGKPANGAAGTGNALPTHELSEEIAVSAVRSGTPPVLPALTDLQRTDTECGYTYTLQELQPISDFPLNKAGYGKSSPVLMLQDGEPMTAHAVPSEFQGACTSSYRHAGFLFLFSPDERPENAENHEYTAQLGEAVPMPRGDDNRPMYWVYPGTTLTFSFENPWDPSWGAMQLDLSARVMGNAPAPATVSWGDNAIDTEPAGDAASLLEISEELDAMAGPWTLTIASPADGPYVLLNTLTLGNPENALVITSELAFVRGAK